LTEDMIWEKVPVKREVTSVRWEGKRGGGRDKRLRRGKNRLGQGSRTTEVGPVGRERG